MSRTLRSLALAALVAPASAPASPRPLPMSHPFETLVEDQLEIEQRVDAVPVRVPAVLAGGPVEGFRLRADLETELRLGWSDRLELGASFVVRQDAGAGASLQLGGFAQRARLRLAEAGDWPVDVALQVSLAQHTDGVGGAERAIVSWRTGALHVLGNFEVEQRYASPGDEWRHAFTATGGVDFEIAPGYAIGAEYWARGRLDAVREAGSAGAPGDPSDPGDEVHHYAGPAVHVQRGRLWVSAGAHLRLDRPADIALVGEPFGKVWVRALIGLAL